MTAYQRKTAGQAWAAVPNERKGVGRKLGTMATGPCPWTAEKPILERRLIGDSSDFSADQPGRRVLLNRGRRAVLKCDGLDLAGPVTIL